MTYCCGRDAVSLWGRGPGSGSDRTRLVLRRRATQHRFLCRLLRRQRQHTRFDPEKRLVGLPERAPLCAGSKCARSTDPPSSASAKPIGRPAMAGMRQEHASRRLGRVAAPSALKRLTPVDGPLLGLLSPGANWPLVPGFSGWLPSALPRPRLLLFAGTGGTARYHAADR